MQHRLMQARRPVLLATWSEGLKRRALFQCTTDLVRASPPPAAAAIQFNSIQRRTNRTHSHVRSSSERVGGRRSAASVIPQTVALLECIANESHSIRSHSDSDSDPVRAGRSARKSVATALCTLPRPEPDDQPNTRISHWHIQNGIFARSVPVA